MTQETIIEWPSFAIPLPRLSPHEESLESSVVRTEMESGRARQRRRFEVPVHLHSAQWKLNEKQMAAFEAFVRHGIAGGSLWFLIELRLADGLKEYKARLVDGDYSVSREDRWATVSATLEIDDQPLQDNWQLAYDYIARVEADDGDVQSLQTVYELYQFFNDN